MRTALLFLFCCCGLAAQIPPPTGTPSQPFFIKQTWIIGGRGNWDYLTLDPAANRLYIAHGAEVQVVDTETGNLAGSVKGLVEAHSIALDPAGEFGYVSDGATDEVKVFDRSSFEVVASIPTARAPRAIALDPSTHLLVAICGGERVSEPTPSPGQHPGRPATRSTASRSDQPERPKSAISIIDVQARVQLAHVLVAGHLGFAESDASGRVYIAAEDHNAVVRLDLSSLAARLHPPASPASGAAAHSQPALQRFDWSDPSHSPAAAPDLRYDRLGPDCRYPRALTVDAKDSRVFVACSNLRLAVLDSDTGKTVATVPIGPGPDAVGFDPDRGLIFTANGGAQGSLTVIRQEVPDSYAVVQILPTRQQARTLAINPGNGQVYLVTVIQTAQVGSPPLNGLGTLKLAPEDASFQVLVVGN